MADVAFGCVNNTIRLSSGLYFDLADPKPDQFTFGDITSALAKICRFGGQCPVYYSVAEHSVLCVEAARELYARQNRTPDDHLLRSVLLHDAAEAFIGDMVKPLKTMLLEYKKIEDAIEEMIQDLYECDFGLPIVKRVDRAMLIHERNSLWKKDDGVPWTGESEVDHLNSVKVAGLAPAEAQKRMESVAAELGIGK